MKFTEFTEGDNKKVTDETIVNEAEPAFKLDIQTQYPTPANDNRAPKSNVVDINQYRDELKKLDNAGQKELQNYIKKNKSLWSRLSGWGAKTAGRHAGATVASTVTGPLSPAVAAVANLALLGYDVYTLGNTIYDWAKGNDVDLKKADSKNATGPAPFTAPPRPTSQGGRNKRIDRWDRLYGKTHNPDGTAIEVVRPPFVPPLGPAPSVKPGDVNTDKIDITTPSSDTLPNIQDPGKLGDPAPAGDSVEFDPNIVGDPNKVIIPPQGPFKLPDLKPDDGIEIVIPSYEPPVKKQQKQKLDPPAVGKAELPTIGTPPAIALKTGSVRKTPPGRGRTTPSRKFGGLPSSNQQKATYRLNPFTPLPMPDPMNLSRYKSFGESIDEREMTKKEKAKEKRLKKKYDDSDMKASMKKQYGKDWKTVYYATIRKKAMEQANEGYQILPSIDKARYDEIQGMEGPMMTTSGKVLYYDPQEGAYYDRDSDMYLSYEEFKQYDEPIKAESTETEFVRKAEKERFQRMKDKEMRQGGFPMSPNEVERQKRIGDGGGYSPPTKKPTSKKSTYMKPIISFPRDTPTFDTILQNAMERMNEAPGDEELLKPMIDMDPKVLPIYAKNIIKKYPHLKPSVNAMIGKNEAVATEAKQLKYNFAVVDANDFDTVIGFTTDLRDAKEMANRHTKNGISNGKIIKLKKPMSQKKGDMMINRPMEEGVAKFYDEYDTPVNIQVTDDKLLYNDKDIKMYNWSIAQSMLTPQMYKNAKSWDDVHAYLKSADDKGQLHQAIRATFETNPENITTEASSPWTSSGKHPEDMDRDELEHEIDIFKQYKKAGMSLSPQEIMRMDSLYDYLDTVDDMVKVTNIKWDSDDDVSDLSTTMMVPVPPELDDEDAEEFIANYITDKTGMTHDGFMIGESNLNEGYEGEISAILQALDIEHHWQDGRLHVSKRDVEDVKDRLGDTDMEMPKITIY